MGKLAFFTYVHHYPPPCHSTYYLPIPFFPLPSLIWLVLGSIFYCCEQYLLWIGPNTFFTYITYHTYSWRENQVNSYHYCTYHYIEQTTGWELSSMLSMASKSPWWQCGNAKKHTKEANWWHTGSGNMRIQRNIHGPIRDLPWKYVASKI